MEAPQGHDRDVYASIPLVMTPASDNSMSLIVDAKPAATLKRLLPNNAETNHPVTHPHDDQDYVGTSPTPAKRRVLHSAVHHPGANGHPGGSLVFPENLWARPNDAELPPTPSWFPDLSRIRSQPVVGVSAREWQDPTCLAVEFSGVKGVRELVNIARYFSVDRSRRELERFLDAIKERIPPAAGWIQHLVPCFQENMDASVAAIILHCPLHEHLITDEGSCYTVDFVAGISAMMQQHGLGVLALDIRKQCQRNKQDSHCQPIKPTETIILSLATIVELLIAKNVFHIQVQCTFAFSQTVVRPGHALDCIKSWGDSLMGNIYRVPWHPRALVDLLAQGHRGRALAVSLLRDHVVHFTPGTIHPLFDDKLSMLREWYQMSNRKTLRQIFAPDPVDGPGTLQTRRFNAFFQRLAGLDGVPHAAAFPEVPTARSRTPHAGTNAVIPVPLSTTTGARPVIPGMPQTPMSIPSGPTTGAYLVIPTHPQLPIGSRRCLEEALSLQASWKSRTLEFLAAVDGFVNSIAGITSGPWLGGINVSEAVKQYHAPYGTSGNDKQYQARYRTSEKGKATAARWRAQYRASPAVKAANRRYMREYWASAAGKAVMKAARARYTASERGKANRAQYVASGAANADQARYAASERGKVVKAEFKASGRSKAYQTKYAASEHGKTVKAQYRASDRGKAASARYAASDAGKASQAKYNASDAGKAAQAKYKASKKSKAHQTKYAASDARKAAGARYATSEHGKAVRAQYIASEKGKAAVARATAVRAAANAKKKAIKAAEAQSEAQSGEAD